MSHFCTHDEKTMPELAHLSDQPGCSEARVAVYAASTGNRKETMQYAFEAVYVRAEAFNRDGEAAQSDSRQLVQFPGIIPTTGREHRPHLEYPNVSSG
jgi:hypothetical protein